MAPRLLESFGKSFKFERYYCKKMKLFLIDGHALVFKMYYAFLGRPMVNSRGEDTSILFGFTKYLLELVEREKPTHLAVSFDPPGGTFRNEMFPVYKANRSETPQLVIDALEPLTAIVKAMDIPVMMIRGFEADDVVGSAAKRFRAEGMDVYMVTPDKDYGQLIAPGIYQYRPGKAGGDNEVLGVPEICEKWGISRPEQVIDILTLCGDAADNVPGVAGVGPVGAAKLLAKYDSVEGIYDHLGELSAKQREKFEAARDHIGLSKALVTIKTDIPLEVSGGDLLLGGVNTVAARELMDRYEMPSLKRLLGKISSAPAQAAPVPQAGSVDLAAAAASSGTGRIAVNLQGGTVWIARGSEVLKGAPEDFRALLEDPLTVKVGVDIKSQINALAGAGITLGGRYEDIELMHYILNPERSHKLDILARSYLGVELDAGSGEASTGSLFDEVEEGTGPDRTAETLVMLPLASRLAAELDSTEGMRGLYDRIEEPLIGVLARMEQAGVKVDLQSLNEFADGLSRQMLASEARVRELSGVPTLNVGSPKQIGEVIFEKMNLDPKAKKPKSGNWPTDEQTLTELSDRSPIIDEILEYRGTRKLLSTYIEPFPSYVRADGRVHTTFNQALTSTGRLSSSNPNLQNIPIRTEQGREIRKAFVPGDPGSVMMSADYSQIELRIMAHLCGDEHLCAAFREGTDVHAATASKIFHIPVSEVTPDQRRIAKTANFGIMYGISAFGLSQRLKCSRGEAKQIIDDYFASFPSIRSWIDDTLAKARRTGYVETLFGRRRYVPELTGSNANVRALAERNAVNAPIQGTSADIIKLAMTGVDRRLREERFKSRMVLQIHDELVLEVPRDEIERVRDILVSEMEGVIRLDVPLTVECKYGKDWLEAH